MAPSSHAAAGVQQLVNEQLNQREMREGARVLSSKPVLAWLSITGKCNLLCTHCPRSIIDEQHLSSDEMTPEVFSKVKDDVFPALTQLRVGGNNFGEQLFARTWGTYASDITGGAFTPWLITNGQTLNRNRITDLVSAGCILDVSVDAASEEKYFEIRGASLAKLTAHVRAFLQERDERQADDTKAARAKAIFSFTAFADNIGELPALVRLAVELGVDEVVVNHYMPSLEGQRFQSLYYHQQTANRTFDDARAIAAGTGLTLKLPPPYPQSSLGHEETLRVQVKDRYGRPRPVTTRSEAVPPCSHPWTSVSINERGEVFPCCQSNLLMGDLRKESFADIWNNGRYQRLRQTVNTAEALHDCKRCVLRGSTFTSVDCEEGSFFLRNLDLPAWTSRPALGRLREWLQRTPVGRWAWSASRFAYKRFLQWHFAR